MNNRLKTVEARIVRVIGPDMFEADVDLGFDIRVIRRLKLASVNSQRLFSQGKSAVQKATEFLRSRIEGQEVVLKLLRKGEHFYAHVFYGPEERDMLDEMVTHGMLERFSVNEFRGASVGTAE